MIGKSKFAKLNDPEWLRQKYIDEKLSSNQIAEMVGTTGNNVTARMKQFGIKARSQSEARQFVKIDSRYDLLNNGEWLKQKYIDEKKSTKEICKLVGAKTANSVRQALIKFGIPVRSVSDGLTCNREEDGFTIDLPVMEGSLLGDAGLKVYNQNSDLSYPHFYKKNKYYDHVCYVAKSLFPVKWEEIVEDSIHKCNGKELTYFGIRSLCCKDLLPHYRKWYPESSGFKKVVPRDLVLTPGHLLHWFMDDGSSHRRKGYGRRSKQIVIVLCSESFSREDHEFLQDQMSNRFGIRTHLQKVKWGSGYRIAISQSQVPLFYDTIGSCPVASLAYKWK